MKNKELQYILAILLLLVVVITTEASAKDATGSLKIGTGETANEKIYYLVETAATWTQENRKIALTFALFLTLCAVSYGTMTFTRAARMLRKLPNVYKFPLVGSLPFLAGRPESIAPTISRGIELLGRRLVFWAGHSPVVTIAEANGVQKILSSTKYVEKGTHYKQFQWLMGNGLITSNGKIWKEDRKLLSPSFKYQRYDGFLETFNRHSKILVDILSRRFTSSGANKDTNLHPILARATMDFIVEAALGQTSDYQRDIDAKFLGTVHKALNIFRTKVVKPWLNLPIIWGLFGLGKDEIECTRLFSEMLQEVINTRKELLASGDDGSKSGTKPFIDPLLDNRADADIKAHVLTIYGAGFETTASGMNYTLFLLALNPKCQSKVHEELDRVFGTDGESDGDVTFDDLSELKYLEMCIKESLRLFPPAPIIMRHAHEDITLDDGLIIPKGVDISFPIYHCHRDPLHFPDPEAFDPARFLPEACVSRHPYAYIPFSAGPRNCLGLKYAMMQMKTALTHILRKFTVTTNQKYEDLKVVYGMVLEPFPVLEVTMIPRGTKTKTT